MVRNVKIPKSVAGVKLPRKVRKRAKKALKIASGPAVREFAAAAIGAAGKRVRAEGVGRVRGMHAHVEIEGSAIGEAFRVAAIDGLRRFLEGFEEGLRNAQAKSAGDESPGRRRRPSEPAPPGA
jgi:hypothetical protein